MLVLSNPDSYPGRTAIIVFYILNTTRTKLLVSDQSGDFVEKPTRNEAA